MTNAHDSDRAKRVIETYGASPARWPEAERGEVERAAEASPELRSALEDEAALDAVLDADPDAGVLPSALRARLLADAPRPAASAARRPVFGAPGLGWARPAAMAATLLVGVTAGYAGAAASFSEPELTLLEAALTEPGDPFAAIVGDET